MTAIPVEEETEIGIVVGLEVVETEFVRVEGSETEVTGATEDIVMSMVGLIVVVSWVEKLVVSVTV